MCTKLIIARSRVNEGGYFSLTKPLEAFTDEHYCPLSFDFFIPDNDSGVRKIIRNPCREHEVFSRILIRGGSICPSLLPEVRWKLSLLSSARPIAVGSRVGQTFLCFTIRVCT